MREPRDVFPQGPRHWARGLVQVPINPQTRAKASEVVVQGMGRQNLRRDVVTSPVWWAASCLEAASRRASSGDLQDMLTPATTRRQHYRRDSVESDL